MSSFIAPVMIYLASWCYVLAQYYHLHLSNWTFVKAMVIAMPLVVVEYCLSLNGNKIASNSMSPPQILTMTIGFYVLNIMILNIFVFKSELNLVRDGLALLLILAAILVSTNARL
jgi:uncharacterized protein (DUF486 family)